MNSESICVNKKNINSVSRSESVLISLQWIVSMPEMKIMRAGRVVSLLPRS